MKKKEKKTSIKIPAIKKQKGDFVKIIERNKKYSRGVFFGVITSVGSDSVTAFTTTEDDPQHISSEHFSIDEYLIEDATEGEVIQYFTYALHARKRKVEELSFDIDNEQRRLIRTQMAYSSFFGDAK